MERGGIGAGVVELGLMWWNWGGCGGIVVDAVELGWNTVELGQAWLSWGQHGGIEVDAG